MNPRRPASRLEVWAALVIALALAATLTRRALGDDVPVPIALQSELLAKVATYDKNFYARAGERVKLLIVAMPGNAESESAAAHFQAAIAQLGPIGGLPHEESVIRYAGAAALVDQVRAQHVSIVYVAPGFGGEIDNLAGAFRGVDVLSAGAVPDYVPRGIVLGFDVVSGKPKLLANLKHAKQQNVAFKSEVLKIMRVYE